MANPRDHEATAPASRPESQSAADNDNPEPLHAPPGNGYLYDSFPIYDASAVAATPTSEPNNRIPNATKPISTRALAPDLLRGLLMIIMALDHIAVALRTWEHGTGRQSESDGMVIHRWNFAVAYVTRSFTHLCGSGFTFLLGMGIVYLGRSRTRLGWSPLRLIRYFAVRAVVLTVVSTLFGLLISGGQIWFLNMVLFSLAVDYFLAGLLWLAIEATEKMLAQVLVKHMKEDARDSDDEGVEQPLLPNRSANGRTAAVKASNLSWHIHNAILFALSVVTIFWNIWLSENHGHCEAASSSAASAPESGGPGMPVATTSLDAFLRIWFWPVMNGHVMSGFPPMAWISFAILGLLYGRIMVARPWTRHSLAVGHVSAALLFILAFVLTRVLRVGNLSEDCLQTPEHKQHPDANPYLVSPASFFYIVKYPPDVAFWALTCGVNFLLLAAFGGIPIRIASRFTMLLDFGTTALFFYIAHLLLIFSIALPAIKFFGHDTGIPSPMDPDDSRGIDNLYAYFGTWAFVMLVLWPICRSYSRFKSTKSADSIWRFF